MEPLSGLLGLLVLLVTLAYLKYRRTYSFWSSRGVKGPTPLPFFGNVLPLLYRSIPEVDIENSKYGKVYGTYEGSKPILMITDAEIIKQIYVTHFNTFPLHIEIHSSEPVDMNHILAVNNEDWKRARSIISTTFTGLKMKQIFEHLPGVMNRMFKSIDARIEAGQDIELGKTIPLWAIDIICKVFFSLELDVYKDPEGQFVQSVRTFFNFNMSNVFWFDNLPTWIIGYFMDSISIGESMEYLKNFFSHVVKARSNDSEIRKDFLQTMIDAKDENAVLKGKGMTELETISNSIFLIAAAFETSTGTFSFTLWQLAHHVDIQEKAFCEIEEVVGSDLSKDISYDDIAKLVYLDAIINETLRIHTPDVRGFRRNIVDTTVPGTDIKIPKGTLINVPLHALHNDPELYPEPEKFKPERFLPENTANTPPTNYMAFGAGPRMCVGKRFAMLNLKQGLAELIRRYKISKCPRTPKGIPWIPGNMLLNYQNYDTVFVKLEKRNNN